jgi:hypothetical protein
MSSFDKIPAFVDGKYPKLAAYVRAILARPGLATVIASDRAILTRLALSS